MNHKSVKGKNVLFAKEYSALFLLVAIANYCLIVLMTFFARVYTCELLKITELPGYYFRMSQRASQSDTPETEDNERF